MTIELLEIDLTVAKSAAGETTPPGPRSGRVSLGEMMAVLTVIAYFAAMFCAVQWCFEAGLQMIAQQPAEHLRGIRGF